MLQLVVDCNDCNSTLTKCRIAAPISIKGWPITLMLSAKPSVDY